MCANTISCSSAALIHSSSITLPLGAARYLTPLFLARCTLSANGKNASLEHATPSNFPAHSFFSDSLSGAGTSSNCPSHWARSPPSSTSPLTKRSIAFAFSARLTPFLNGSARTRGWCRNHQLSALDPASRVQWMRDCCPAPRPTIAPFLAYETLLDCVYLTARVATMRSVSACVGTCGTVMVMCYGESKDIPLCSW